MLAPIRPRPIMPSGMRPPFSALAYRKLCERLSECRTEFGQASFDVSAEVNPQGPSIPLRQHLEITLCLCRLDAADGVFLPRNGQVLGIITRHLDEHA